MIRFIAAIQSGNHFEKLRQLYLRSYCPPFLVFVCRLCHKSIVHHYHPAAVLDFLRIAAICNIKVSQFLNRISKGRQPERTAQINIVRGRHPEQPEQHRIDLLAVLFRDMYVRLQSRPHCHA